MDREFIASIVALALRNFASPTMSKSQVPGEGGQMGYIVYEPQLAFIANQIAEQLAPKRTAEEEERLALINASQDLAGAAGAQARLWKRMDPDQIRAWLVGEIRVRGTRREDLELVMAETIAALAFTGASVVGSKEMPEFAASFMRTAAGLLDKNMRDLLKTRQRAPFKLIQGGGG